jgi:hypothetical protein
MKEKEEWQTSIAIAFAGRIESSVNAGDTNWLDFQHEAD